MLKTEFIGTHLWLNMRLAVILEIKVELCLNDPHVHPLRSVMSISTPGK